MSQASGHTAKVLYFAALTDFTKTRSHELILPLHGAPITDIKALLLKQHGDCLDNEQCRAVLATCAVAINLEYADWEDASCIIKPGDEVALIPPVSGG